MTITGLSCDLRSLSLGLDAEFTPQSGAVLMLRCLEVFKSEKNVIFKLLIKLVLKWEQSKDLKIYPVK